MIRFGERENTMLKFLACATEYTEVSFVKSWGGGRGMGSLPFAVSLYILWL